MLVNDRYFFLFVHIQKTAGTSITHSLEKLEGTKRVGNPHSFFRHNKVDNPERYFKFCFVRNPWDRLVSWYNMLQAKGFHNDWSKYILSNSTTFSEFLDLTDIIYESSLGERFSSNPYPKSISFNQLDYITDEEGKLLVDFIGKFENLQADYAHVMEQLNIDFLPLQHLNKLKYADYRTYYSDADIEKVFQLYKRDIEYFKYQF